MSINNICHSTVLPVTYGLPQDSILGLLLATSKVLLFADDNKSCQPVPNYMYKDLGILLQSDLSLLDMTSMCSKARIIGLLILHDHFVRPTLF